MLGPIAALLLATQASPARAQCDPVAGIEALTEDRFAEAARIFQACIRERPNEGAALVNFADAVLRGRLVAYRVEAVAAFGRAIQIGGAPQAARIRGGLLMWKAEGMSEDDNGSRVRKIIVLDDAADVLRRAGLTAEAGRAEADRRRLAGTLVEFVQGCFRDVDAAVAREVQASRLLAARNRLAAADAVRPGLRNGEIPEKEFTSRRQTLERVIRNRIETLKQGVSAQAQQRNWAAAAAAGRELVDFGVADARLRDELRDTERLAREELDRSQLAVTARKARDWRRVVDLHNWLADSASVSTVEAHRDTMKSAYENLAVEYSTRGEFDRIENLAGEYADEGFGNLIGRKLKLRIWYERHKKTLWTVLIPGVAAILLVASILSFRLRLRRAHGLVRRARKYLVDGDGMSAVRAIRLAWTESEAVRTAPVVQVAAQAVGALDAAELSEGDRQEVSALLESLRGEATTPDALVELTWNEARYRYGVMPEGLAGAATWAAQQAEEGIVEGLQWVPAALLAGALRVGAKDGRSGRRGRRRKSAAGEIPIWSRGENLPLEQVKTLSANDLRRGAGKQLGRVLLQLAERFHTRFDEVVRLLPPEEDDAGAWARWQLAAGLLARQRTDEARKVLGRSVVKAGVFQEDEDFRPVLQDWARAAARLESPLVGEDEVAALILHCRLRDPEAEVQTRVVSRACDEIMRLESAETRIQLLERLPADQEKVVDLLAGEYVLRGAPDPSERTLLERALALRFEEPLGLHFLRVLIADRDHGAFTKALAVIGPRFADFDLLEELAEEALAGTDAGT